MPNLLSKLSVVCLHSRCLQSAAQVSPEWLDVCPQRGRRNPRSSRTKCWLPGCHLEPPTGLNAQLGKHQVIKGGPAGASAVRHSKLSLLGAGKAAKMCNSSTFNSHLLPEKIGQPHFMLTSLRPSMQNPPAHPQKPSVPR